MPIKIQSDLPAKAELEEENIFVMDENRAISQNIRPLEIIVLNLMPIKQDTELQLLRGLSNTPLQIDVTFLQMSSHVSKNTSASHIKKFYQTFEEIKNNNYDGMIITGAPVEKLEFEWSGLRSMLHQQFIYAGVRRQDCITIMVLRRNYFRRSCQVCTSTGL